MPYFSLKTHTDESVLFDGYYPDFQDCLEDAVKQSVHLTEIDLSHQNLNNFNLDNALMQRANFSGANLSGTNLSEADLLGATYFDTTLYNTCFSYSCLENSDFRGASFGATLIEGCFMHESIFSTLSCFDLDFTSAESIEGSLFETPNGMHLEMSCHPVVVKGLLSKPIIILDHTIAIGMEVFPKSILPDLGRAIVTAEYEPVKLRS